MQPSQNAVEIALELNWSRLFGYAFSLTGDAEGARDLLQHALNALASTNMPSDRKAARAWLFKIVRNAWIDQHRRQKVRADDDW